jgi:hypothetical protein
MHTDSKKRRSCLALLFAAGDVNRWASESAPMTITASVCIATSLDGFIARENGAIDWLMDANGSVPPGEDCGYAEFMSTVDVLIMGRNTY